MACGSWSYGRSVADVVRWERAEAEREARVDVMVDRVGVVEDGGYGGGRGLCWASWMLVLLCVLFILLTLALLYFSDLLPSLIQAQPPTWPSTPWS